jgi:hypothetical protein
MIILKEIEKYLSTVQNYDTTKGIESLLYGVTVRHLKDPRTIEVCTFYINHLNNKIVNYCYAGVKFIYETAFADIDSIHFGKNNGVFIEKPENKEVKEIPDIRCLTLRVGKNSIDLIFTTEQDLNNFVLGINLFYTDRYLGKNQEMYL